MKKLKRLIKIFMNGFSLRNTLGVVEWYQEGNEISVKIQRCGIFKTYVGIPFVCKIPIDLAKIA